MNPIHTAAAVLRMSSLLITLAAGVAQASAPQSFRPGTELFVDDEMVAVSKNVTRTLHAAAKLPEPVLKPNKPWENGRIYIYGTVDRDEKSGKFRMWYSGGGLAYAESDDGVNWVKPELDYVLRDGKPTNLLYKGRNICFLINDIAEPDPAKRYKLLDNTEHHNFIGMYSADGMVWKEYERKPLVPYGSEISNGVRDPKTGQYFVYIRPYLPKPLPKNVNQKRLVSVITSSDFENWSEPKLIIQPDQPDDLWVKNEVQRTEFYGMSGFPYGNQYLGLLPVFKVEGIYKKEELTKLQSGYEGPIEGQLVTSRDGLTWQRTKERKPVIPPGPHQYDAGCIMNVASIPTIVGDEVWYYYTALSTTHGGKLPEKVASIALAKWRLDGFASLDAAEAEGVVETKPLNRTGKLQVNADASKGKLTVEVIDASGKPLPGYTASDCHVISTDNIRHAVRWGSNTELPSSGPVQLRFALTNASLYSYTIESSR